MNKIFNIEVIMKIIKLVIFCTFLATGLNTFCMEQDEHKPLVNKENGEEIVAIGVNKQNTNQVKKTLLQLLPADMWREIAQYLSTDEKNAQAMMFFARHLDLDKEILKIIIAEMLYKVIPQKVNNVDELMQLEKLPILKTTKSTKNKKIILDMLEEKMGDIKSHIRLVKSYNVKQYIDEKHIQMIYTQHVPNSSTIQDCISKLTLSGLINLKKDYETWLNVIKLIKKDSEKKISKFEKLEEISRIIKKSVFNTNPTLMTILITLMWLEISPIPGIEYLLRLTANFPELIYMYIDIKNGFVNIGWKDIANKFFKNKILDKMSWRHSFSMIDNRALFLNRYDLSIDCQTFNKLKEIYNYIVFQIDAFESIIERIKKEIISNEEKNLKLN